MLHMLNHSIQAFNSLNFSFLKVFALSFLRVVTFLLRNILGAIAKIQLREVGGVL